MTVENSIKKRKNKPIGGNNRIMDENPDMAPEARREFVLSFIDEHDMPLPPLAIWAGMNQHYRVTFSYRTMQNILSDLVEQGDLFRVDTSALREGEVREIADDGSSRRSYYYITDAGRERVRSEESE